MAEVGRVAGGGEQTVVAEVTHCRFLFKTPQYLLSLLLQLVAELLLSSLLLLLQQAQLSQLLPPEETAACGHVVRGARKVNSRKRLVFDLDR